MNVSPRCWSPFHTNECVFSRNEQQKVYIQLSKSLTDSFYQSFSSLFINHLEVHSRWYIFEYRHCRCLAIALNRRSVSGQIQYKKPPEQLCLLNNLLRLVPVQVLTLSCYMIGVILIFQSLCQKKTFS